MLAELSADGVAAADFRVGQIHEFGEGGVDIDLPQARGYYERSAKAGNLDAADYLARALFAGRGGARDRAAAIDWWDKAARKGHAGSISNLSWVRCISRDSTVSDPEQGTRLVSMALQMKPTANLNDTLAACLAAAGLFDQAVATQQETLTLAERDAALDAEQKRAFADRLARYQRQEAWLED